MKKSSRLRPSKPKKKTMHRSRDGKKHYLDAEVENGTRHLDGRKKLKPELRSRVPVKVDGEIVNFDMASIRTACRDIRVKAGELEVAMISTGKYEAAVAAAEELQTLLGSLQQFLKGDR